MSNSNQYLDKIADGIESAEAKGAKPDSITAGLLGACVAEFREMNDNFRILAASQPSKRELFAAMALQGIMAKGDSIYYRAAKMAVDAADALIEELEKPRQG